MSPGDRSGGSAAATGCLPPHFLAADARTDMLVAFHCPSCEQPLAAVLQDYAAGKDVNCPTCNQAILCPATSLRIPRSADNRRETALFAICPQCFAEVAVPGDGRSDHPCPHCGAGVAGLTLRDQLARHRAESQANGAMATATRRPDDGHRGQLDPDRLLASKLPHPLLGETFRFNFYADNPFRLLRTAANVPEEQLTRNLRKAKNRVRVKGLSPDLLLALGSPRLDGSVPLEQALVDGWLATMEDGKKRFINALFWPSWEGGKLPDGEALLALLPELTERFHRDGATVEELHALAVMTHMQVLEHELGYLAGEGDPPEELWQTALCTWNALLGEEGCWQWLRGRLKELDGVRVREDDLDRLRLELPAFVLGLNRSLAQHYLRAGGTADCVRHLFVICESGFPVEAVNPLLLDTVQELTAVRLESLVQRTNAPFPEGAKTPAHQAFAERFDPLLAEAEALSRFLSDDLQLGDDFADSTRFDVFVNACLDAIRQHLPGKGDDGVAQRQDFQAALTLERLTPLPMNDVLRARLRSLIEDRKRSLFPAEFGGPPTDYATCFFLPGEPASASHSLVRPMVRIDTADLNGHTWTNRRLLIPRSALAAELHEGHHRGSDLLTRCPNSPLLAELRGRRQAVWLEAIEKLVAASHDRLARHRDCHAGLSRQYGAAHDAVANELPPARQAVAAARARLAELQGQVEREQRRAEAQAQEHHQARLDEANAEQARREEMHRGLSGVALVYLPAVVGVVIVGLFVAAMVASPLAHLLASVNPALTLPRGGYVAAVVVMSVGLGMMLGSAVQPLVRRWVESPVKQTLAALAVIQQAAATEIAKTHAAALQQAMQAKQAAEDQVAALESGAKETLRQYQAAVDGFCQEARQVAEGCRQTVASVVANYEDFRPAKLRQLKQVDQYAPMKKALAGGFKEGTEPDAGAVREARLQWFNQLPDSEIDALFLKIAVMAIKDQNINPMQAIMAISAMPSYEKRQKLRDIIRGL